MMGNKNPTSCVSGGINGELCPLNRKGNCTPNLHKKKNTLICQVMEVTAMYGCHHNCITAITQSLLYVAIKNRHIKEPVQKKQKTSILSKY